MEVTSEGCLTRGLLKCCIEMSRHMCISQARTETTPIVFPCPRFMFYRLKEGRTAALTRPSDGCTTGPDALRDGGWAPHPGGDGPPRVRPRRQRRRLQRPQAVQAFRHHPYYRIQHAGCQDRGSHMVQMTSRPPLPMSAPAEPLASKSRLPNCEMGHKPLQQLSLVVLCRRGRPPSPQIDCRSSMHIWPAPESSSRISLQGGAAGPHGGAGRGGGGLRQR